VKRTSSATASVALPPPEEQRVATGTQMRELGENRRLLEQIGYSLDGAEATRSLLQRRAALRELLAYCDNDEFIETLRISSELTRSLSVALAALTSNDSELMALGAAYALRLLSIESSLVDLPVFVRVLVAMLSTRVSGAAVAVPTTTPAVTQSSLEAGDDVSPPPVKKRRSFGAQLKRSSSTVAVGGAAATEQDTDKEARRLLFESVAKCNVVDDEQRNALASLSLPVVLSRVGTLLLCGSSDRLETGMLRNVMRECGAIEAMSTQWTLAVQRLLRREPSPIDAVALLRYFECVTFDSASNQFALVDAPQFLTSVVDLLCFLDADRDSGDEDEVMHACMRALLNVSNNNDIAAKALLDSEALVTLLLRWLAHDAAQQQSRDSDTAYDRTMAAVALLINCVETSATRCEALLASKPPMAFESVLALLVRLFTALDDGQTQSGEPTQRRVLQSYVVLLLGCLCMAGDHVRNALDALVPTRDDGVSGLIGMARLLEAFLEFQQRNGILTHDLHEQGGRVAQCLRGVRDGEMG
jgi:hypothetical protein